MPPRSTPPPPPSSPPPERRRNPELRDLLDEMLALVRHLSHRADTLTPSELDYARQRLDWLSDEVWALLTRDVQK